MDNATILIVVIVAVIALLFIALVATSSLFLGATLLLAWASSQGFIGVAIYFALWIFAFPLMLIASIITVNINAAVDQAAFFASASAFLASIVC